MYLALLGGAHLKRIVATEWNTLLEGENLPHQQRNLILYIKLFCLFHLLVKNSTRQIFLVSENMLLLRYYVKINLVRMHLCIVHRAEDVNYAKLIVKFCWDSFYSSERFLKFIFINHINTLSFWRKYIIRNCLCIAFSIFVKDFFKLRCTFLKLLQGQLNNICNKFAPLAVVNDVIINW